VLKYDKYRTKILIYDNYRTIFVVHRISMCKISFKIEYKMNDFIKPTEAELEILHILWQNGASSVRCVNEKLCENREVGYTTTLKMMQMMYDKGLLSRDDSTRSHTYEAIYKQEETQQKLLNQFVNSTFKGSAMQLVMQALGNHEATDAELSEIKALIEQMENKE
jgi:BlaI family transcriptional regulator, penicillinase repressor